MYCLLLGYSFELRLNSPAHRPFPIVLVKCWKVAHWNAQKLQNNWQKFQKLPPKFLDILI